jgi:hypothetical protein
LPHPKRAWEDRFRCGIARKRFVELKNIGANPVFETTIPQDATMKTHSAKISSSARPAKHQDKDGVPIPKPK